MAVTNWAPWELWGQTAAPRFQTLVIKSAQLRNRCTEMKVAPALAGSLCAWTLFWLLLMLLLMLQPVQQEELEELFSLLHPESLLVHLLTLQANPTSSINVLRANKSAQGSGFGERRPWKQVRLQRH